MEAQFVVVVGGFVEHRSRFVFTYRVEGVVQLLLRAFTC